MPRYEYRCEPCGGFARTRPMAASAARMPCPACGAPARRVFGAPALHGRQSLLHRAQDTAGASADAPAVVGAVPGRSRRATPLTRDPRHARLPRP